MDENTYASKGTDGIIISVTPSPTTSTTICKPVEVSTKGNIPQGNYAYGDEYICDPGDGVERTFFVLEDGDTTTLTVGEEGLYYTQSDNIGLADKGEVSLIMSDVLEGTTPWIDNEEFGIGEWDTTKGPQTAINFLKNKTADWSVRVNLPTMNQIYAVTNNYVLDQAPWLFDGQHGYLTSTAVDATSIFGVLYDNGDLDAIGSNPNSDWHVRPVITISKTEISTVS